MLFIFGGNEIIYKCLNTAHTNLLLTSCPNFAQLFPRPVSIILNYLVLLTFVTSVPIIVSKISKIRKLKILQNIITVFKEKIYSLLNGTEIPSIDEHEIFHPRMDIVELDDRKHEDLLQIMSNRTGDFKLNTGDFIKGMCICFDLHVAISEVQKSFCTMPIHRATSTRKLGELHLLRAQISPF